MSIQKRTVFFDDTGGVARFWDWSLTTTTLGTMAEPFMPNARHQFGAFTEFDPADEISRIDEIRASTVDKQLLVLSGGDRPLNGGYQLPRDSNR